MAENQLNEFPKQIRLEKPALTDWPRFEDIQTQYPELCAEEHVMMFDALLIQAHERKAHANN